MNRSITKATSVVLCIMLASACAVSQPSPPAGTLPISDISVQQAQQDQRLPLSDQASRQPSDQDLPAVRWGGTIAEVSNRADGSTVIEIVSRPLLGGGRPVHDDRSYGRFMAEVAAFLDPEIIQAGRDMTVVGHLSRRHPGKVGDTEYLYPVVSVQDYRYWKKPEFIPQRHFPHWNSYPPYGYYDPFWDDWPFSPYHRPRPPRR